MGRPTFNYKLVIKLLGFLLFLESFTLLLSSLIAWFYKGPDTRWLLLSALITAVSGILLYFIGKKADRQFIGKREGYFFVTAVWLLFSVFGLLPFYLGGYIPSLTDAFFETISGFTTTGATILTNIEQLPHGILFWRSLIQWLGGMGIILLSLAIMPLLNMGNLHLFAAEVPGPTVDKLQPRIISTARILWVLYLLITLTEAILLKLAGMSYFDAVCHSLTTMATGGFSTKDTSIAWFGSPLIEYIIIVFMFIAGTNFSLIFWVATGKFSKIKHNDEFTGYLFLVLLFSAVLGFGLWFSHGLPGSEAIRSGLFQVISFLTTTGYTTLGDYMNWRPLLIGILVLVMIVGGMSGSTSGGMKVARVVIYIRQAKCELKKIIHPNAVFPVRYNGTNLQPNIVASTLGFLVFYILLVIAGIILFLSQGIPLDDAMGTVISGISNVGPGFGEFSQNYALMPDVCKWTLSFLMVTGRLEIYTVLLLLVPYYWKR